MKRIIFTVTNDLNYDQRMQRICNSLCRAGFEVLLAGRKRKQSKPLTQQPFNQKRFNCIFEKGKLFYIEYNLRLFFFLLFANCDIISAVDLDTILTCSLISTLRHKTCVYDAHEYFPEVPEVINRKFTQSVWSWIEGVTVPNVDVCYTVSEGLKTIFEQKYNKPFTVIRNLPVLQELTQSKTREKIILYQGALNQGRGLEQTIEAMQQIDAQLLLAGDGDITNDLMKRVVDLKLESKVKFFGYVLPADLKQLTQQATIGINVLEHTGESYYHSLPNKVFDYIQAGVPSVNMDFPEMKKLNEQYHIGILINECTPVAIADAVNNLLNNQQLYDELQKNCLAARLELNWQNEENKLIALYTPFKG
jgi:glycosyltransferase involved in cell wall biosynthesis